MSAVVQQLAGTAATALPAAGGRERVEVSASGASYEDAYAQLQGNVQPGWLLMHVRRVDAGETP